MEYSIFRFTLNMHTHRSQASVAAFCGDTAIRLCFTLADGSNVYKIDDGCTAVLSGSKADGTKLWNRCTIEDNTIIYDFTEQTASCPGIVSCEITLYGADGKEITSPKFTIIVDSRDVSGNDVSFSESEYTAIDVIMEAAAAEAIREANEAKRQSSYEQAHATANAAKEIAKTAETKSDSAVSTANEASQISSDAKAGVEAASEALKATNERVTASEEEIGSLKERVASAEEEIEGIKDEIAYTTVENVVKLSQNVQTNTKKIEANTKRITNLEARLPIGAFIEDDSVAYKKIVPENACPFAQVNKIGGKTYTCSNLIKPPYYHKSKDHRGIHFTDNGDGSITLNGMNDGTGDSSFYFAQKDNQPITLESGTYTVSVTGSDEVSIIVVSDKTYTGTFTLSSTTDVSILIRVDKGNTTKFNNVTVYPMLNKGSTALPWEPYWEGTRDTKVTELKSESANLLNPAEFELSQGLTYSVTSNEKGALIINGIHNSAAYSLPIVVTKLSPGIYTFSIKDTGGKARLELRRQNERYIKSIGQTSSSVSTITFEWTEEDVEDDYYFCVRFWTNVGFLYNDYAVYLMLHEGVTALPYSPYGEIDVFTIPEEIQAIEGYGQSNPDNPNEYNYIDFDGAFVGKGHMVDGQWVAYDEPRKVDISEYLTHIFMKVAGGGTITAVNEYEYDAPSTITYLTETAGD